MSGFKSANIAGVPFTFTAVVDVTLYVFFSVNIEFLGSTVIVMVVVSTETTAIYTSFAGGLGLGGAAVTVMVNVRTTAISRKICFMGSPRMHRRHPGDMVFEFCGSECFRAVEMNHEGNETEHGEDMAGAMNEGEHDPVLSMGDARCLQTFTSRFAGAFKERW